MNSKEFIASGIIEAYCLGVVTDHQAAEVMFMELLHEDVREEIGLIHNALEKVRSKELKLSESFGKQQ